MNFSEFTTPNGRSSILVEVTHREDHIDLNDVKDEVYEGLIKSEIIKERAISSRFAMFQNSITHM